jgi:aspartate/methionine/tyrosine aminotransferase
MALKTSRRGDVPPFIVMDVLRLANERAARGDDVLHLEVGQPSTGAPSGALAAAAAALSRDALGYTEALGLPSLRARIARHYRDAYGLDVPAERVVVTTGSSGAFILAFLAAFDAGDRVALAAPGYPAYRSMLQAFGIEAVSLEAAMADRFQPTVALLERATPLDGLIVASPANPTGAMIERDALAALAAYCEGRGIRLVSDEVYHGITYGTRAATALEFSDEAVVANSFSKYFSMTGWRIGWMVVPEAMLRSVECLAQNLFISPPTLAQIAAAAAMDCRSELDANVARYGRNRGALLAGLPTVGVDTWAPADGAFYVYADVSRLTNDSEELCRRVLAETGVALTPGIDFDAARGRRYVRISYAGAETDIAAALARLSTWAASGRSRS